MSLYQSVRRGVSSYFGLTPDDQAFALKYKEDLSAPNPTAPLGYVQPPPPPPGDPQMGPVFNFPIPYYEPPTLPPGAYGGIYPPPPPPGPPPADAMPPSTAPSAPPLDLYASPFAGAQPPPPPPGEPPVDAHRHRHHHGRPAAVPAIEMDRLHDNPERNKRYSAPPPGDAPDAPVHGDGAYVTPARRVRPRGRGAGRLREEVTPSTAPATVGEKRAPGTPRPKGTEVLYGADGKPAEAKKKRPKAEMPIEYKPFFTLAVTLLEIGIYIFELLKTNQITNITFGTNPWQWGGVNSNVVITLGGKYAPYILDKGEWWRFFTPIFMHVSLPHITMNLLTQLKVGGPLEKSYGATRMFLIYVICGVTGNLMSCIFIYNQIQAGASGALFGFMGLLFVDLIQNWSMIMHPLRNLIILTVAVAISLAVGLLPGVDNFAHVGGFVMGIISGFVFLPSLTRSTAKCPFRRTITVLIAAPLMIAYLVTLFVVFYAVVGGGSKTESWCPWCSKINCAEFLLGETWCQTGI